MKSIELTREEFEAIRIARKILDKLEEELPSEFEDTTDEYWFMKYVAEGVGTRDFDIKVIL